MSLVWDMPSRWTRRPVISPLAWYWRHNDRTLLLSFSSSILFSDGHFPQVVFQRIFLDLFEFTSGLFPNFIYFYH